MKILSEEKENLLKNLQGKKSKINMKEFYFVETRTILRNRLRESVGSKNMRAAWKEYQAEHSGSPKLRTYTKIVKV